MTTGLKFPKSGVPAKVVRRNRRDQLAGVENKHKTAVRKADKRCRFPLCGCGHFRIVLHVAHLTHKGAGGDPTSQRSLPSRMLVLCASRHRENRISLDKGTLRVQPLTRAGTRGPCAFLVDMDAFVAAFNRIRDRKTIKWFEVGRERAVGVFDPFTEPQRDVLQTLQAMEV